MAKSTPQDAIALLKADHRKVEELFEQFEKTNGAKSKAKIAQQICLELSVHTAIEEELFYPAVKEAVDEEIYTEAQVEHDSAKMLIAEIMTGAPDEEFYDAKVSVLSEMIKHHVKEEEQRDGMFAQAKKSEIDMDELGEQMTARKIELTAEYEEGGLPTPQVRSMKGAKVQISHPVA